jgi:intein-encoded DNA endonuclease-like protein
MNKNLAYFAGALRDGTVYFDETNKIPRVSIYNKNKQWLTEIIRKIFSEEFKSSGTLTEIKANNFKLEVRKKNIFEFCIKQLEFSIGSQCQWITPDIIKTSDIDIQKEYVKGFFDAEGTVIISKKNYDSCLRIYQSWHEYNSCPPLEDVKTILDKLKIKCTLAYSNKPHGKKNKMPNYALIIRSKESIMRFFENVGSYHPDKSKKLLVLYNKLAGQQNGRE